MKINIFEGARRIGKLVLALWVLAVGAFVLLSVPSVTATYHTTGPDTPFLKSNEGFSCGYSEDVREYEYRETPKGTNVWVTLCFQAMPFPDNRKLVPYMVASDGQWWGDTTYSGNVTGYTRERARQFTLPRADAPQLDRRWWSLRFEAAKTVVVTATIGCVVLWFLARIIGWIVRGFLGIPMGRDARL